VFNFHHQLLVSVLIVIAKRAKAETNEGGNDERFCLIFNLEICFANIHITAKFNEQFGLKACLSCRFLKLIFLICCDHGGICNIEN
jgi:hypothetical protein